MFYNLTYLFPQGTSTCEVREAPAEADWAEPEEARRQASQEDEGALRDDGVQEER